MRHRSLLIVLCVALGGLSFASARGGERTFVQLVAPPKPQATTLAGHPVSGVPHWVEGHPGSAQNILYVTDTFHGSVHAYADYGQHGDQIGRIDGFGYPYGAYVDREDNIWVCDWAFGTGSGKVFEFERGTHRMLRELSGLRRPLYVYVDEDGVAYVGQANNGQVAIFAPGSSNPTVLQTPGVEADGITKDRHGNLFVAYRHGDPGGIVEYRAGSKAPVDLGIHIDQPQGLAVDAAGDLIVAESQRRVVDVFPPGATQPSERIVFRVPTQIALDELQSRISVSELGQDVARTAYPFDPAAHVVRLSAPYVQGAAFNHDL